MKVIVGLGNPGPQYETTRHNVGFLLIDYLIDEWKAQGPKIMFGAQVFTADLKGQKILLVKPQTFMNLSGRAVGPLVQFYKLSVDDVIVVHDDIDLRSFALKIKTGGGSGGHNGIKSLDQSLGTPDYHRLRIGVGRPERGTKKSSDYVLEPFMDAELEELETVFSKCKEAIPLLLEGQISKAQNQYHNKE